MKRDRRVTPKDAALAALAALREHIVAVEARVAAMDDEESAPLGLSNEYQSKLMRVDDGLAVHCWSTHSYDEQPEPSAPEDGAFPLALAIAELIGIDAARTVSDRLYDIGYFRHPTRRPS